MGKDALYPTTLLARSYGNPASAPMGFLAGGIRIHYPAACGLEFTCIVSSATAPLPIKPRAELT